MTQEGLKSLNKIHKQKIEKKEKLNKEYITTRSALGNDWAIFYFFLGGREAGKSYDVTHFFIRQFIQRGRPFYWMRLTETSKRKLLTNNAEKLIDPDLRRKYNLDLVTNGDNVYMVTQRLKTQDGTLGKIVEKKLMARVMDLSTFYNDKGSGLYDNEFLNDPNMYYNICLDEMNREMNERKTFDIVYAFVNQLENLVRSTKKRLRVILIGNTLEEASDILCSFNFIPEKFGRFYLKKKRAIIDNIAPSEKYLKRRKGTIADILMPNASTFTNEIKMDTTLIYKKRLRKPISIIMFSKDTDDWFTLWDKDVIAKYNKEHVEKIPMRPYLDSVFITEQRDVILTTFDLRGYKFKNLITFKLFQKNLELLRPKK